MEIAQERCVTCGEPLEAVLGLSFGAPLQYEDLPHDERATRATLTDDRAGPTIDGSWIGSPGGGTRDLRRELSRGLES